MILCFTNGNKRYSTDRILLVEKCALEQVERVEATGDTTGTKAHWKCTDCGDLYWDAEGTDKISDESELTVSAYAELAGINDARIHSYAAKDFSVQQANLVKLVDDAAAYGGSALQYEAFSGTFSKLGCVPHTGGYYEHPLFSSSLTLKKDEGYCLYKLANFNTLPVTKRHCTMRL